MSVRFCRHFLPGSGKFSRSAKRSERDEGPEAVRLPPRRFIDPVLSCAQLAEVLAHLPADLLAERSMQSSSTRQNNSLSPWQNSCAGAPGPPVSDTIPVLSPKFFQKNAVDLPPAAIPLAPGMYLPRATKISLFQENYIFSMIYKVRHSAFPPRIGPCVEVMVNIHLTNADKIQSMIST